MKKLLRLLSCLLPWPLRRWFLQTVFHYRIHPTARIGLAWVFPQRLEMGENSYIGHLTVVVHLDLVRLAEGARIGKGNWITGFPSGGHSRHFAHQPDRRSELTLGRHTAITNRHLIDCTSPVTLGSFVTFAGFQSQVLTHSIDIHDCRQSSAPVTVGDYCFVGTNCVLLGGSSLPSHSVLGAKSLLNKAFEEEYTLYGGAPARVLAPVAKEAKYFHRTVGFVE